MELKMIPQKVAKLQKEINRLKKDLPITYNRIEDLYLQIDKEMERYRFFNRKYYEQLNNNNKKKGDKNE
jgi:hypothetical protein